MTIDELKSKVSDLKATVYDIQTLDRDFLNFLISNPTIGDEEAKAAKEEYEKKRTKLVEKLETLAKIVDPLTN